MKSRLSVITEYSRGRTFAEAVYSLFYNGLMNGTYSQIEVVDIEQARLFHSWYLPISREAEVKYIITEKYDEEKGEWWVDYTEGIEILPCQL